MLNQEKKILLIEDENVGQSYVDLLENSNPFWKVTWVKTISEIKAFQFLDSIHVFIFDQRLGPNELGTDAFSFVREKNPRVQGIMLSGVALAQDYDKARNIAKNSIQYLNKENVLNLPQYVNSAIEQFYATLPKAEHDNTLLKPRFPFKLFQKKPVIRLLSHYVLEDDFIFEDKWRIDIKIRSGENVKSTETKKKKISAAIVTEVETSFLNQIGTETNNIIKRALEGHFSLKKSEQFESELEIINQDERSLTLSQEQSSNNIVQVNYEYNDLYTKYRVHISLECPMCCGIHYLDYDICVPQNRILERCVEYNSSETRITELSRTIR